MAETPDADPFSTPTASPAAASLPLPPPTRAKVPIPPDYVLDPSSPYWYKRPSYLAPIPGTFDSYERPNPHYRDLRKLEEDSADRTAQLDSRLTSQEDNQIASAEAIVTKLRAKQAIRKQEVAKTQRFRSNQLRDRALERQERNVHIQELAFSAAVSVPADTEVVNPATLPTSDSQSDLFETESV
jgi:hypothetical protein